MKILIWLFLVAFLPVSYGFSQDSAATIVHINKIPAEGILLNKGWKFQRGDNPEYARPGYDDRTWKSINPALDVHDSLLQIPRSGICWFRLNFSVDSSINHQLALNIYQSGASEVYLNGQLIAHFGVVSINAAEIRAYDPWGKPVLIPLNKRTDQVLAVRYTLQPGVSYTIMSADFNNPALAIRINTVEGSMQEYYQQFYSGLSVLEIFRVGVLFILVILHLAFYLFYPPQKANLYFFLFAFFFLVSQMSGVRMLVNQIDYKFYYYNLAIDLLLIGYAFMLNALYILLAKKRGWIFWTLTIIIIVSIFLNARTYALGQLLSGVILPWLVSLEIARIAVKSIRKKKKGAAIILGGAIGFMLFTMAYVFSVPLGVSQTIILSNFTILNLGFNFANLSIPIATSIYLGLDFAFTNRALTQKLSEVEDLSKKTIAQEQEKQQILADQNIVLEQQVTERTAELNQSLTHLKATQTQLIQSEKMASLGELTAGIAHEIQNPLNFVNNFSEVSVELLDEMDEELDKGDIQEAKTIGADLKQNLQKIQHHGKRADFIVKGMLEHSRTNTGEKQLTDMNVLCDEFLKLSYHGLRAKDKSFNGEMVTHFDPRLPKVNVSQQDMGRVMLNLFNNAFYAVNQKKKTAGADYLPTVEVTTFTPPSGGWGVKVKDNGIGIPDAIKEKIMQPFFTTKPTGEGTGLGLSLTYDMVVKGHGGTIAVETTEGAYTEFTITLPIS